MFLTFPERVVDWFGWQRYCCDWIAVQNTTRSNYCQTYILLKAFDHCDFTVHYDHSLLILLQPGMLTTPAVSRPRPAVQPKARMKPSDKMLQSFNNSNNAIIMDLSWNENTTRWSTLITDNSLNLPYISGTIFHHFWPCILCQGQDVQG